MNQQMAQQTGLTEGVYIYSVVPGGAAEKSGLKVGDVITKIDDKTVASMEDLTAVKKGYTAGSTSTFTVYRAGTTTTVPVTWESVPVDEKAEPTHSTQELQPESIPGNGNINDLFEYFFNGQMGNQGGSGTAA